MTSRKRNEYEMVVIGDVRYRPEDVPKDHKKATSKVQHKARTPEGTASGGDKPSK